MKRTVRIIVLAAVAGAALYVLRGPIENFLAQIENKYSPCQQPIAYTLGSFDSRFGISKSDFLSAIVQAKHIWEQAAGKELFVYEPGGSSAGKLKINLIYDYRQQATEKLKELGIAVSDDRASYNSLKSKYDALYSDYTQQKAAIESRVADFQSRQSAYETQVEYWNGRDGAPQNIYNQLNNEKVSLDAEAAAINQLENSFNAEVDNINAMAVVLNRLVSELNLNVEQFNEIGQERGSEFDEGLYQNGPSGQEIDIYQFDNYQKLVRVLAHELGHALGLGHVDDPKAIMYRLNQRANDKLTAADIAELKQQCGMK